MDRVKVAGARRIVLVGHSFGCRNTAHLMLNEVEKLSKDEIKANPSFKFECGAGALDSVAALVLIGYPICDTKGDASVRRKVVERLWQDVSVPVLFIKGTKDSDYGIFSKCVQSLAKNPAPAARTVHDVEGGGHNPFKGGSARKVDGRPLFEHHNELACAAIASFIAGL
jgi:pimeloyl-ACP methyl ester carboxylesterase